MKTVFLLVVASFTIGLLTSTAAAVTKPLHHRQLNKIRSTIHRVGFHKKAKAASRAPLLNPNEFSLRVPILTYHYIREDNDPKDLLGFHLSVSPQEFEQQMGIIAKSYQTITPDELLTGLQSKHPIASNSVLLTFDDGYADFYTAAFPVLKKYHLKATVFIVPGFLNNPDSRFMTTDQIKELDQSGLITIGAHTRHHVDLPNISNANDEILGSKQDLETMLQHPVKGFAYPYGHYNDQIKELVRLAGFDTAVTTHGGDRHQLSHRFELSRKEVIGGRTLEQFEKLLKEQAGY